MEAIGEAQHEDRRSYVTVMFADVCDYTLLSEQGDPEDIAAFMSAVTETAGQLILKHGGSVSQLYGDGILAVFGYPAPQEDDVRRAVEAAIELHEAVKVADWRRALRNLDVRMHTGVHCGLVLARPGNMLHGRYRLVGDTVNTTARLCSAAQRDEILVSETALRGVDGFFITEAVRALNLKGKRAPLAAFRVAGRSGVRSRFEARARRGLTPFVGRERELANFERAYSEALAGSLRVVVVNGPGGIGKTRLLQEFRERIEHHPSHALVLAGNCDSYGEIAPLAPFLEILAQAAGLQRTMPPQDAVESVGAELSRLTVNSSHADILLQLLSLRPWPAGADRASAATMVAALISLFGALSDRSALVLLLDDWQWADDTSRKILAHLMREFAQRRLCIAIGMRGDDANAAFDSARVMALQPFTETEARRLIDDLRPQSLALDLGLASALYQRSGGHPLFLEELCKYMLEPLRGNVGVDGRDSSIPHTLQSAIQCRVAMLPADQVKILQVAAAIGLEFSTALLQTTLERSDLPSAELNALCASALIYTTGADTYRFKHGIVREAVYESILISERVRLHRLIACAIEQTAATSPLVDHSEALAYHFRSCEAFESSSKYAERAGDKAMASFSLDRACFHYACALSDLSRLEATAESKRLWLTLGAKWALPCLYSPVWARGHLHLLERALVYAVDLHDQNAEARAGHWLGWLHYVLGNYPASLEYYERSLELVLRSNDERLAAQLWCGLGATQGATSNYPAALDCLDKGLQLKRLLVRDGLSRTVAQGFAYQLGCRALVHADVGEFRLAAQDMSEALSMISDKNHPIEGSVLGLKCITLIWQERIEECLEVATRARSIDERTTGSYGFAMATAFEAYARWIAESDSSAIHRMQRAVEWLESQGIELYLSFLQSYFAEACFKQGEHELARKYATHALLRARQGDRLGEASAYRTIACLAASGNAAPDDVWPEIERAFAAGARRGSERELMLTHMLAAELHAAAKAYGEAREAVDRVLAWPHISEMPRLERAARVLSTALPGPARVS